MLWDGPLDFRIVAGATAAELAMLVEEQRPRSISLLNGKRGQGLVLRMKARHAGKIEVAQNIDIVDEKRLVFVPAVFEEKP